LGTKKAALYGGCRPHAAYVLRRGGIPLSLCGAPSGRRTGHVPGVYVSDRFFPSFPLRAAGFFLDLPEAGSLLTGCPLPASTQRGSCRKAA